MHLVIIGGGITGLSAAWEAQQRGLSYTLLEASDRWGGKVVSTEIKMNGARFLVDGGPDTIVTRKPEAWDLTNELGILDQVEDPGSETRGIYVLDNASPQPIPLSPFRFISSTLMTNRGKFRLMAEPFQPARKDDGDESLGDFVRRRLGEEALDKFIGPVLGGIYNTDPNLQSIMVSSPVMREMEKEAGSLFIAAIQRGLKSRKNGKTSEKKPRFITYKSGLQGIVDGLVSQLTGELHLKSAAHSVVKENGRYKVYTTSEEIYPADAVIFATLANVTAELLTNISGQASALLNKIGHNHIGTVSLVYKESDIPGNLDINGLMIPRREKRAIDAVTFSSKKMPQRFSSGYAVLRVFIGGGKPEVVECSDKELLEVIQHELLDLLGISALPLAHKIFRWENGFPQAKVGHLDLINEIEEHLPANFALAGSSYRGIAVPDCIRQGREAVKRLLCHFEQSEKSSFSFE
ncbi:MAG TPA: protoporphyrinogen oxidase [Anaerolineales bacterium]|nr:protoporphyrinogen oxidase [Anaerolineales bacterium]